MNHRTISVQCIDFKQVYIFGKYLPSQESIDSALSQVRDKRNQQNSSVFFNEITEELDKSFNPDGNESCPIKSGLSDRDKPYPIDLDRVLNDNRPPAKVLIDRFLR